MCVCCVCVRVCVRVCVCVYVHVYVYVCVHINYQLFMLHVLGLYRVNEFMISASVCLQSWHAETRPSLME